MIDRATERDIAPLNPLDYVYPMTVEGQAVAPSGICQRNFDEIYRKLNEVINYLNSQKEEE